MGEFATAPIEPWPGATVARIAVYGVQHSISHGNEARRIGTGW